MTGRTPARAARIRGRTAKPVRLHLRAGRDSSLASSFPADSAAALLSLPRDAPERPDFWLCSRCCWPTQQSLHAVVHTFVEPTGRGVAPRVPPPLPPLRRCRRRALLFPPRPSAAACSVLAYFHLSSLCLERRLNAGLEPAVLKPPRRCCRSWAPRLSQDDELGCIAGTCCKVRFLRIVHQGRPPRRCTMQKLLQPSRQNHTCRLGLQQAHGWLLVAAAAARIQGWTLAGYSSATVCTSAT